MCGTHKDAQSKNFSSDSASTVTSETTTDFRARLEAQHLKQLEEGASFECSCCPLANESGQCGGE
jgi:hypothetical protein